MKISTKEKRRRYAGIYCVLLISAAVLLLSLTSCFAPGSSHEEDKGVVLDVQMSSRGSGSDTVLAGFVIHEDFEESLKEATQLMVGIDADGGNDMDSKFEEIMLDLALGGTIKFGENPYFAIEVPRKNNEADFTLHGIPSGRDYLLYMGGFDSLEEVRQFFGLIEEKGDYDESSIPYSHLFYVKGQESGGSVTVPFDVSGVSSSSDFTITTNGKYNGAGWYLVNPWGGDYETSIKQRAGQPFSVKKGKEAKVNLVLVEDGS